MHYKMKKIDAFEIVELQTVALISPLVFKINSCMIPSNRSWEVIYLVQQSLEGWSWKWLITCSVHSFHWLFPILIFMFHVLSFIVCNRGKAPSSRMTQWPKWDLNPKSLHCEVYAIPLGHFNQACTLATHWKLEAYMQVKSSFAKTDKRHLGGWFEYATLQKWRLSVFCKIA